MREYRSRREAEEAEKDPELDLKYVWECDKCGDRMETYSQGLVTKCVCGGNYIQIGESYNG